jgi:hypothetical protein
LKTIRCEDHINQEENINQGIIPRPIVRVSFPYFPKFFYTSRIVQLYYIVWCKMKNNIWFPLILVFVLWLFSLGGAYATVIINGSANPTTSTVGLPTTTKQPTSTAVPPTTATPKTTTPVVLNGQAIFNANCLSCHRSRPPTTNRTQANLLTFISNHNTGRNLNAEQVAALVSFLKP